jgi:hypothetical protein
MRKMTDPISECTLKECINALKRMDADLLEYGYAIYIADRIHDLTRWIPVSERMPSEEEWVLVWLSNGHSFVMNGAYVNDPLVTHWRRITPPEDKP